MAGFVVAITGIDGVGKSSVLSLLEQRGTFANASFVKKTDRTNVETVEGAFPAEASTGSANFTGWYATSIRWAHAFDFLNLHATHVVPVLERDGLVIADRWSDCSVAYANTGTSHGQAISHVLRACAPADQVIHIQLEPEVAFSRIKARGEVKGDEDLHILTEYHRAYDELYQTSQAPVARFHNDSLEETVDAIEAELLCLGGVTIRL